MRSFSPINLEVERAALGCALNTDETAHFLANISPELFVNEKHKAIHKAVKNLMSESGQLDIAILREQLLKAGKWDDSGNGNGSAITLDYLVSLQEAVPAPSQIKSFLRQLEDAHRQRKILTEAEQITKRAGKRFLTRDELTELEDRWQQSAFEVSAEVSGQSGLQHIESVLHETIDAVVARRDGKSPPGLMTGFAKLDAYTSGLHSGELAIICARPQMGKTSLALDVSVRAVKEVPVAFFSLEMSADLVAQRLLAKQATVNLLALRSGRIRQSDLDRMIAIAGDLSEQPLFIDESSSLTPQQIRSRVRQVSAKTRNPIGLVVIDYLQLLTGGRKYDSREREVSSISREMKRLAKDLSVPVIVLSQLNRQLESRLDKRPALADLRESGAIEQDADLVLALFRPFPYTNRDEDRGKAECIILKQRQGPIGAIELQWVPETATFWDA